MIGHDSESRATIERATIENAAFRTLLADHHHFGTRTQCNGARTPTRF